MASVFYVNMQEIFFLFFQDNSRSETVHLFLRNIIESFKLHYLFLNSNICDKYFAVWTQ